jgi:hypothetical protein
MKRLCGFVSMIFLVSFLTSCSAIDKEIKHGKLEVLTKMSDTIFLDPVGGAKRTIFVKIMNTSGYDISHIEKEIRSALEAKDYRIVHDHEQAHYILQANILQVGKVKDGDMAFGSLHGGYGAVLGAGVVMASSDNPSLGGAIGGALIGSAVEYLADAAVQVCYYSITTDIQISEKASMADVKIKSDTSHYKGRDKSKTSYIYSDKSDRRKYLTRIVSLAKKTNLKFEDAEPEMTKGLVSSIAGIF